MKSTYQSRNYGDFKIVERLANSKVKVRFIDTGYEAITDLANAKSGRVKDRNARTVYGVGFIGDGIYKSRVDGKTTIQYSRWSGMLARCYGSSSAKKYPAYIGCSVADEWHSFQLFSEWFQENYPDDGLEYHLDKDIKVKGNKVYSPETCLFVTATENSVAANAKTAKIISPGGVVIDVYNISKFARDNSLSDSTLCSVINGNRIQHKGWRKCG